MTKLEEFKSLVQSHDLTYQYSDDHRAWSRGSRQFDQILALSKELPRTEAVKIWNENADAKLGSHAQEFYWKE